MVFVPGDLRRDRRRYRSAGRRAVADKQGRTAAEYAVMHDDKVISSTPALSIKDWNASNWAFPALNVYRRALRDDASLPDIS